MIRLQPLKEIISLFWRCWGLDVALPAIISQERILVGRLRKHFNRISSFSTVAKAAHVLDMRLDHVHTACPEG